MLDKQTLLARIDQAFGGVTRPGWEHLWDAHPAWAHYGPYDWEIEEMRAEYPTGISWKDLDPLPMGGEGASLLYCNPTGFPYFLAAYLWKAITDIEALDAGFYSLVDALKKPDEPLMRLQLRELTPDQVEAVKGFLAYALRNPMGFQDTVELAARAWDVPTQ